MQIATVILLFIIASLELTRLLLTHLPSSKKAHFKKKLEGVNKTIADLEFKIFKTREIREDVRQIYNDTKGRLALIESQLESFSGKEEDKKNLEDKQVLLKRDSERYENQIKMLDLEIEGSKPTVEHPDGVDGISNQIDSLVELKTMLKNWIKTL